MKILDAEFVKGFIRMANDGWEQGWHERNGGNLSYRIRPEEVESVKENFEPKSWTPIGTKVPKLGGEYFLVTGSGKFFRNCITLVLKLRFTTVSNYLVNKLYNLLVNLVCFKDGLQHFIFRNLISTCFNHNYLILC